jgi:NAD-dependent SIR2 family protein deacetylase
MRFVADGPDIPNALIAEWREGKVVFIAGAGISVPEPSNLPTFRCLVLRVYQSLHDPLFDVLSKAEIAQFVEERNKILAASGLSAKQRVEANLFFRGEYDRLFAALESRLDQDSKGLVISRHVRNAVESVLRAHGGNGIGHRDLIRISTAARLRLDPTTGRLTSRIATTNFDLLLEEAAAIELPNSLASYDARTAYRPGSYDFEGIIHLHGMLDARPDHPGNLILTSRDFARTYLRSGVVANYIYDLVRRYRVVLVGYSADDPTMRYLMDAIGEDAALFDDMRRPFAIAARDPRDVYDPLGEVFIESWRAKNIEPITYDLKVADGHGAFWRSLHQWAEWARRDLEWVKEQCAIVTALPFADADGFAKNFVGDLFSVLDQEEQAKTIQFLNEKAADFDWIDAIRQVPAASVRRGDGETIP